MRVLEREPRRVGVTGGGREEERQAGRHGVVTPQSPATCVGERGECWQVAGRLWQVRKLSPPAGIPGPERAAGIEEKRWKRRLGGKVGARGGPPLPACTCVPLGWDEG